MKKHNLYRIHFVSVVITAALCSLLLLLSSLHSASAGVIAAGRLEVQKVTEPVGDPAVFTFTHPMMPNDVFTLTGGSLQSFILDAGVYSVTEIVPDGWILSGTDCTREGNTPDQITIGSGEVVTCVFTNTKEPDPLGNIVIEKVTDPEGDTAEFAFTNPLTPTETFMLTGGSSQSFMVPAGTYTTSETVPDGWTQTSAVCGEGGSPDKFEVTAGGTITCTFTNTADPSPFLVDKTVDVGSEQMMYTIEITNTSETTGTYAITESLETLGCTPTAPESFTTETFAINLGSCTGINGAGTDYYIDGNPLACDIPVGLIGTVFSHEATYSFFPIQGSYSSESDQFDIVAPDGTVVTYTGLGGTFNGSPYSYSSNLDTAAAGASANGTWQMIFYDTSWTPGGHELNLDETSLTLTVVDPLVTLGSGESTTLECVTPTGLDVSKTPDLQYVNVDDTVTFDVTVTNNDLFAPADNIVVDDPLATCIGAPASLAPGASSTFVCVSPNVPDGFTNIVTVTADITATNTVTVTNIDTGDSMTDTVTITFPVTDTDDAVVEIIPEDGLLTIEKITVGDDGTFTFDITGTVDGTETYTNTTVTTAGGSGSSATIPLPPGFYVLTERAQFGWQQFFSECVITDIATGDFVDFAFPDSGFNVEGGNVVTCTFQNERILGENEGTLEIVKIASPDDTFTFTVESADGTFTRTLPIETFGGFATSSLIVISGTYTIDELVPDGWALVNAECNDFSSPFGEVIGDPRDGITVSADAFISCVFSNVQPSEGPSSLTLSKNTSGDGDDTFTFNITTTTDSGTAVSSETLTTSNGFASITLTDTVTGTYNITEVDSPDWNLVDSTCFANDSSGGFVFLGSADDFTILPGWDVTCEFTNQREIPDGQIAININKDVTGEDSEFTFAITGTDTVSGTLNFVETVSTTFGFGNASLLAPEGTYSISEIVPDDYILGNLFCFLTDSNDPNVFEFVDDPTDVTLTSGQELECNFSNIDTNAPANFNINKNSGTADEQFTFIITSTTSAGTVVSTEVISTFFGFGSTFFTGTAGTYTITEQSLDGWTLTGATCGAFDPLTGNFEDLGDPADGFTVNGGWDVFCDFNNVSNDAPAFLNINKNTGFESGQFTFVITGATTVSETTVFADFGFGSAFETVPAGTYTITETPQDGWVLVSATCGTFDPFTGEFTELGDPAAGIDIPPGANVDCTFTNAIPGEGPANLLLNKNTSNGEDDTFTFVITNSAGTTTEMVDTAGGFGSIFLTDIATGTTSIAEVVTGDWILTDFSCFAENFETGEFYGIDSPDNFVVLAGYEVNCFANNEIGIPDSQAEIIISKNTFNGEDDTFTFAITGTGTVSGTVNFTETLTTDFGFASSSLIVPTGTYSIEEVLSADWTLAFTDCFLTDQNDPNFFEFVGDPTDVALESGQRLACDFFNEPAPVPDMATIRLFKSTDVGDGSFTFVLTGTNTISGTDVIITETLTTLFNSAFVELTVPVGTYAISEIVPDGWLLTDTFCFDFNTGPADPSNIVIEEGGEIECNFFNELSLDPGNGLLTINKFAEGGDGTFTFTVVDDLGDAVFTDTVTTNGGAGATQVQLPVGTYTVFEEMGDEWTQLFAECLDSNFNFYDPSFVPIADGDAFQCNFTNEQIVEPTLTLNKYATGGDDLFTFDLFYDFAPLSTETISTSGGFGSVVLTGIDVGEYSITEQSLDGWSFTSSECYTIDFDTGPILLGTAEFGFFFTGDEDVICDFFNTSDSAPQTAELLIQKTAFPADDTFEFAITGTGTTSGTVNFVETVTTDANVGIVQMSIPAGTYTITESAPPDWVQTAATCRVLDSVTFDTLMENVLPENLTVEGGQIVECYFTNAIPSVGPANLTINKATDGDDAAFTFDIALDGTPFVTEVITTAGSFGSMTWNDVPTGTYSIVEQADSDWTLDSATCTAFTPDFLAPLELNNPADGITILPGWDVTCDFFNTAVISGTPTMTETETAPMLVVSKTAGVDTANVGDTVQFTYVIQNTGTAALDVTAFDDVLGTIMVFDTMLEPGETTVGFASQTIVESDLPGPIINTVVVTGTTPDGTVITATDTAFINVTEDVITVTEEITVEVEVTEIVTVVETMTETETFTDTVYITTTLPGDVVTETETVTVTETFTETIYITTTLPGEVVVVTGTVYITTTLPGEVVTETETVTVTETFTETIYITTTLPGEVVTETETIYITTTLPGEVVTETETVTVTETFTETIYITTTLPGEVVTETETVTVTNTVTNTIEVQVPITVTIFITEGNPTVQLDYSDAPEPYPLAGHVLGSNLYIGDSVDPDSQGQVGFNIDEDDSDNGVTVISPIAMNQPLTIEVDFLNDSGELATLIGYVDLNGDGVWTADEEVRITNLPSSPEMQTVVLSFGNVTDLTDLYGRFRITTDPNVDASGLAADGEVEDWLFANPTAVQLSQMGSHTIHVVVVLLVILPLLMATVTMWVKRRSS